MEAVFFQRYSRIDRESLAVRRRLQNIRAGMVRRCYCDKYVGFENYGGRGIIVCDEWQNDSQAFIEWALSHGYSHGLEIDRRDTNGNYEPANCRWVEKRINSINRRRFRNKRSSQFKGVFGRGGKWQVIVQVDGHRIHGGTFANEIDAARQYDRIAFDAFGSDVPLNFEIQT